MIDNFSADEHMIFANIEEEKRDFYIENEEHCDWYIRTLKEKERHLDDVKEMAKQRIAEAKQEIESYRYLFENNFKQVVRKLIPDGKKSVKMWSGQVKFRKTKANVKIIEKDLIPGAFFKEVIKHEPDKDRLREAMLAHGEVVPGVEVIPEHDSMSIG